MMDCGTFLLHTGVVEAGLTPRGCDGRGTLKLSRVETGGRRAVCGPQAHFVQLAECFINLHLSLFTRCAVSK